MFNSSSSGFHPFGSPQHSGATTGHINTGQQGVIGHNTSPSMMLRKSLVEGLHQPTPSNHPSSSTATTTTNGMMGMSGFQSSLFYNNNPSNHNPTVVGGNNNNGMNNSNNNTLFNSHFVQPPVSHPSSLLNLSQQQHQSTNPLVNNDNFQLLGNSNKLFSPTNNNQHNLSSNLLRNNLGSANTSNPFGLSLLGTPQTTTTEPIGGRSHTMNVTPMVNNPNNSNSSLLSSFHNDFGNSNRNNTSFQQFTHPNMMTTSGNSFGWNNNVGGNNNGTFVGSTIGGANVMNGGQLMSNPSSAAVGGSSNNATFYSPFLAMNQTSNSPSMGQQSHLPLFGSTSNTGSAHNDFFSNAGQFGTTFQQQQPIGRNKSTSDVDFSYLTSSLPLDDDDDSSFLSNQTTNPLFEETPFQKTIQPPLFNSQQQQPFPGISPSSTSSGNNSNDNTTATPSPPPPQFLSSAPEYHNRVLAMANTQYSNPPQQSPTNTNLNYGTTLASMVSFNNFTPSDVPSYVQATTRVVGGGNIPTHNETNQSFPLNGQPSIMEHQNEIKQTGNGYQFVFAPPPSSNVIAAKQEQPKKEVEVKTVHADIKPKTFTPPTIVEKKEEPKKKQEPQKSKSKKKNTAKSETKATEIKPVVESPKAAMKEEPVKSEQEKLDEELAKKLQREFELEYLRNLDSGSNKSKNNAFTTSGKKKKVLEEIPEKLPVASSSTQSNFFSVLESVPAEIQQPSEKPTKKQAQTQPVATKSSKKSKKKKNDPTPQPKKEEKAEPEKTETKSIATDNKEEDYNKPCRDHFKGKCKFGSGICPYSHDRSFYIKYQQEHPDEFPPLATPKSKKKETVEILAAEIHTPQKKTEVCMKHSSVQSCGNGKNCKYIHLSDISLHDLYRKCCTGHSDRICKCAPQNDPPILYIEGVTKLTKKQMQEIGEKSFMKALGVFKMTEIDLYQYLPELKSIPASERKHRRFCYIFPDTCVKLIISKIERSEANRVKKIFNETEEEDLRKRQAELAGQRYDQEKDDELHPTWQIIGLTSHQHCILRFIENMLPLCFVAPDCDSYGEGEPFDEAMYGHSVESYDLRLYPSIMERIFEMIEPDDESDEDISKELLMMMLGKACEKKKPINNNNHSTTTVSMSCIGPILFDH